MYCIDTNMSFIHNKLLIKYIILHRCSSYHLKNTINEKLNTSHVENTRRFFQSHKCH